MPKFAANLTMMFNEVPFPERFAAAAKAGFRAVEFLFPYDYPATLVSRWLSENNLKSALFNMPPGDWAAGERGIASLPGREMEFLAGVHKAVEYALATGTPTIHAMAGLLPDGADREWHRSVYVANLGAIESRSLVAPLWRGSHRFSRHIRRSYRDPCGHCTSCQKFASIHRHRLLLLSFIP